MSEIVPHGAQARALSPTMVSWKNRQAAQEVVAHMSQMGLHPFNPEWNSMGYQVKDGDVVRAVTFHSDSFRECKLTIKGTTESITVMVQTCTKVMDLKSALGIAAMVNSDRIQFVQKQGCSWRIQHDIEEVGRNVRVSGISSFSPQPRRYEHPACILGTGYSGIKVALLYCHYGNRDFIMYDRYSLVGGHAWIVQANKTSKLQTEFAAFHCWFGHLFGADNPHLSFPVEWSTWPKRDEVLAHMKHACNRYNLWPHITLQTNAHHMDIVGGEFNPDRYYRLHLEDMKHSDRDHCETILDCGKDNGQQVNVSSIYQFPGAYYDARRIVYPGEDGFDGELGYGMNDDIPWDKMEGCNAAILGNGAFAVENIRTCMEYAVTKVWLVCRKKNLPSPRAVCWFVHQALVPVPAAMMLAFMEPMYEVGKFGDPFTYHSVTANADRTRAHIHSHSRFGIGDVTFLACAWGRCEYVVDTVKRMTRHTLHLTGGERLEDVTVVIKCLGLIGDFRSDKLHHIKQMVGMWPSYDCRRCIACDPHGMDASNFTTFSAGIASIGNGIFFKYFVDYPQEYDTMKNEGHVATWPTHTSTSDWETPAHQFDVRYVSSAMGMISAACPRSQYQMVGIDYYFHQNLWTVNPLDKYFEECKTSWDTYQQEWWKMGFDHEYTPYPYTIDMIKGWFDKYEARGVGPTWAGPDPPFRRPGYGTPEDAINQAKAKEQSSGDGDAALQVAAVEAKPPSEEEMRAYEQHMAQQAAAEAAKKAADAELAKTLPVHMDENRSMEFWSKQDQMIVANAAPF